MRPLLALLAIATCAPSASGADVVTRWRIDGTGPGGPISGYASSTFYQPVPGAYDLTVTLEAGVFGAGSIGFASFAGVVELWGGQAAPTLSAGPVQTHFGGATTESGDNLIDFGEPFSLGAIQVAGATGVGPDGAFFGDDAYIDVLSFTASFTYNEGTTGPLAIYLPGPTPQALPQANLIVGWNTVPGGEIIPGFSVFVPSTVLGTTEASVLQFGPLPAAPTLAIFPIACAALTRRRR